MATSSITPSAPTRKRRPSADLILRTYRQECITGGTRGGANRAAALLGISDDTVRRVVARDEAARQAREETPPELQFTPPDAAYEAERDRINRMHAAELAARLSPDVRQSYVKNERESGENAAETPHDDAAECRTVELGNTPQDGHPNAAAFGPQLPIGNTAADVTRGQQMPVEPAPSAPARVFAPTADDDAPGIVRDYLRHSRATVQRDGLLLMGWRWIDTHDMIGPFPTRGLLAALAVAAAALLAR